MAILLKVKWVDKSDQSEPHQRIRHIGGDSRELKWKHSQAEAVDFIERRQFEYYIHIEKTPRPVRLDVASTPDGEKYLTAQIGDDASQLLFELPPLPPSGSAI